jgi:GTP-binding protein
MLYRNDNRKCIALVGRPNVGKSRLFNRIGCERISIVCDTPGVTRDVVSVDLKNGATILDTGGIGISVREGAFLELQNAIEEQVDLAIAMADVILFVLDGKSGIVAQDLEIAAKLRKTGKRVIPVLNKVDTEDLDIAACAVEQLGFSGMAFAISAEHNRGIGELKSEIFKDLLQQPGIEEYLLSFALIGAPNVGKSSLSNALLMSYRTLVSDIAGTTRDVVSGDIEFITEDGRNVKMRVLDTAGLRNLQKMDSSIEYFSSTRAREAMRSVDVIFLVLDAVRGLTKFDKKLALEAKENGKCLAVIVNKWDLAKDAFCSGRMPGNDDIESFRNAFFCAIRDALFDWPLIPVVFLSSRDGSCSKTICSEASRLYARSTQKITTGVLNRFLAEIIVKRQPVQQNGKTFKLFYALQVGVSPITIRIYCNSQKFLNRAYESYIRKKLVENFDLGGCSLLIDFVSKPSRKCDAVSRQKRSTH